MPALPAIYPRRDDPAAQQEVIDRICDALRAGTTRRQAAGAASISHETFYRWAAASPAMCDAIARAEAEHAAAVEVKASQLALADDAQLRDVLTYLARHPASKRDWSELTVQAILRAAPLDVLQELAGQADADDYQLPAQQLLAPPPDDAPPTE